jgi:hypothetical protein
MCYLDNDLIVYIRRISITMNPMLERMPGIL